MLPAACPGLFYATPTQDGTLSRIRIPGGRLTVEQAEAIADLADRFGDGSLQVTNRANVQIRAKIAESGIEQLQKIGLASPIAEVDAIRNIMCSPTAGIDAQALIDVRPLVEAWNDYLISHPELAVLSEKFSVAFDGGEAVSVRDRPNDIALVAIDSTRFRLYLSVGERGDAPRDVGVAIHFDDCLTVLATLAELYREQTIQRSQNQLSRRKPRFREILNEMGIDRCLKLIEQRSSVRLQPCDPNDHAVSEYGHLDVHAQRQPGLFYIGVVLPLGRLTTNQLRGLAALSNQSECSELRLTPWQNVLITNLSESAISPIQQEIEALGLHWSKTNVYGAIVACTGKPGCASSATHTKQDAHTIATHLQHLRLDSLCEALKDRPINIHVSGCDKSCAQHTQADITLIGREINQYDVYMNDADRSKFGQMIRSGVSIVEIPSLIEAILEDV